MQLPIFFHQTIDELEKTLHFKWLHTTRHTMLKASDLQDLETNNFEYTAENENVLVCIWGNLSHNSRFSFFVKKKTYEREKKDLYFNLE